MIRQILTANWDMPLLSIVGLLIFFGLFAGAVAWVFRKGSREFYANLEALPLREVEPILATGESKS